MLLNGAKPNVFMGINPEVHRILVEKCFHAILTINSISECSGSTVAVRVAGAVNGPMPVNNYPRRHTSVYSGKISLHPSVLLFIALVKKISLTRHGHKVHQSYIVGVPVVVKVCGVQSCNANSGTRGIVPSVHRETVRVVFKPTRPFMVPFSAHVRSRSRYVFNAGFKEVTNGSVLV